jgi:hypothetical protein
VPKLISEIKEGVKVISFDIISHNLLSQLGIEHEQVETYIDKNDQEMIDNIVVEKTKQWYRQEGIENLLQFENLNLGSLLELEIPQYFLPIIKNFVGIIRIFEKDNPSKIIASDFLASMAKTISRHKEIVVHGKAHNKDPKLAFDRVPISVNIGKKLITFWIPRGLALKVKNIVEFITNTILNLKFDLSYNSSKETILLLDFNPMLYEDFLNELSSSKKDILLLNERIPAIWNIASFRTVKRSKSKIIQLKDLLDPNIQSKVINKQQKIKNNLQEMSSYKVLEQFFSIEGCSFWPQIKENFVNMCSKRFCEAIERYELSKQLFSRLNVKCILLLYDAAPEEKVILHAAHKYNIPALILQHGVYPQGRYMDRYASLYPFIPQNNTKHALWGKETEIQFRRWGVKHEEIILTGSPRHDSFFHTKKNCHNKGIILLALSTVFDVAYYGIDTNTFVELENTIKRVCRISLNFLDKKLIVKLHPHNNPSYDVKPLIRKMYPAVPLYQSSNILNLLRDCDVLVCIGYSTALLEGMILGKPTITIHLEFLDIEKDKVFQSGATLMVKTQKELEDAVNKVLFDKKFRAELIQRGKQFVDDYLVNQGTASQFLKKVLEDY